MVAALVLLIVISVLELLTWTTPLWKVRTVWARLVIVLWALFGVSFMAADFTVWSIIAAVLCAYRIINLWRLVEGRTDAHYLFRVALVSSLWLFSAQVIVCAAAIARLSATGWLYSLAITQLIAATVLAASTRRHLRTTRPPSVIRHDTVRDLPTLTVAIPARNESQDLTLCLQSLTASTYPKLEILVLDDCSQNKRTAEIIRSFAHAGVRFIAGKVPPEHWLAKNYAYDQLAKAANGEILLFCGVDVRFQPDSLLAMVEIMLQKNKAMVSFMPRNRLPRFGSSSIVVQASRYAWELGLPRRWLNRPPVLSTCWLVTAAALRAAGGFEAVVRNSVPESYFSRTLARRGDGYSFLRSDSATGLESVKTFAEQRATAIRTRYPQLHRRPELVAWLSISELLVLAAPFGLLIGALADRAWPLAVLGSVASVQLTYFFSRIVSTTYGRFVGRGLWLLPFAAAYDVLLLNYSMWQYEFREVIWKGRNVCLPVMRALPPSPEARQLQANWFPRRLQVRDKNCES